MSAFDGLFKDYQNITVRSSFKKNELKKEKIGPLKKTFVSKNIGFFIKEYCRVFWQLWPLFYLKEIPGI